MSSTKPEPEEDAPAGYQALEALASDLGVPQHILRYWEARFPQLRPQRAGNRRYYSPDDVALARRIHRLLNQEGYTVRGVQQLLAGKEAAAGRRENVTGADPKPGKVVGPRQAVADEAIPYRASDAPIRTDADSFVIARAVVDLLGGDRSFHAVPEGALDVHDMIAGGIPARALTALVAGVRSLRKAEVFEPALGMSVRTYQRRQDSPDVALSPEQSARLWKFAEILVEATELLGSQEEAEDWLERPATGLDQRRPIDLLMTPAGVQLIEQHLGRLRYGVYA